MSQQSSDIMVEVVHSVENHSEASTHAISSQVNQVDIEAIQSELNGALQVDIRVLCEAMHNRNGRSNLVIRDCGVSQMSVIGKHLVSNSLGIVRCGWDILSLD